MNNQKCWYSSTGLEQLKRKQRQGIIEKEDGEFVFVKWDGNKTPNRLSKIFITTDPLAQLIKSEESPYTDIDENTWFSIEKNNVHVIRENRNVEGNYIDSTESVIPLECVVNKIDENILIEAIIKSAESFLKR